MRGLLADPVVIVLGLLVGGLSLARWRPRVSLALLAGGTATLYLLATPLLSHALSRLAESDRPPAGVAAGRPAAIVVLSAGLRRNAPEYGGATVDGVSLERLRFAARLQRQTGLPLLVTGGVTETSGTPVAEAMRRALVEDFAVPVRWTETSSRNTEENARLSAALLQAEGIGVIHLVTHAQHLPRARRAFERAGIGVAAAATAFAPVAEELRVRDVLPRTSALANSAYALHELTGRLYYRLAYGVEPLVPPSVK